MSELEEIKRSSFRTVQAQSRVTAQSQPVNNQRSEILSALSGFADNVGSVFNKKLQAEVETKKVLGASRAAKDMLVGEDQRQGINEDDSLATQLAYNNILGQHDTMQAGNSFVEWYSQNPEADDKAISDMKVSLYQPLLDKYGNDERSLKQISLQVQESQYAMLPVENKINTEYKRAKSNEALTISVSDLMADPNADLDFVVGKEIPERAKALGLGEFDYKKALMAEAQVRAGDGDARLLNKLNTEPWAKGSAALDKAQSSFDKYVATTQSPQIGNAMGDIEIENLSLSVPWSTTLRRIEDLNKMFPNTYSSSKISSLKLARLNAQRKDSNISSGAKSSYASYTNKDKLPLAVDPTYSDEDRKDIVKYLEGEWPKKQKELVASGLSEEQAADIVTNDQLKWSRLNRVVVPTLKKNVETLINLNDEEISRNDGELPAYAMNGLNLFKKMDDSTVELYLPSSTDQAFVGNFKDFSQNMPDDAAYQRAMQIKRSPFKVTPQKRDEQISASKDAISVMLNSNSWYENLFNSGEGMVRVDVPEWQKAQLASEWEADINKRLYAGGFNVESNAKETINSKMSRMTQLNNGTLTNLPLPELSSYISEGAPTGTKLSSKQSLDYLEAYMLRSKPFIDEAYGIDIDMDNIRVQFDRGGKKFRFFSDNNDPIGGRIVTSTIYNVGKESNLEDLRKIRDQGKVDKESKRAINELSSKQLSSGM